MLYCWEFPPASSHQGKITQGIKVTWSFKSGSASVFKAHCCLFSIHPSQPGDHKILHSQKRHWRRLSPPLCPQLWWDKDTTLWKTISAACTVCYTSAYLQDTSIKCNFQGEISNKSSKISPCFFLQVNTLTPALEKGSSLCQSNKPSPLLSAAPYAIRRAWPKGTALCSHRRPPPR